MFKSRWIFGLQGAEDVMALRRSVFVEEQGISEAEEFDSIDGYAAHVLVDDETSSIATGRMYPQNGMTYADHICVNPAYRGEPYAELVLRIMLDKAQQLAGESVAAELTCEEAALYLPFGFVRQSEERMVRKAQRALYTAPRNGIIWDSPCKHI